MVITHGGTHTLIKIPNNKSIHINFSLFGFANEISHTELRCHLLSFNVDESSVETATLIANLPMCGHVHRKQPMIDDLPDSC